MPRLLLFGCIWLVSSVCAGADAVTSGMAIADANVAMQKAGYEDNGGLAMVAAKGQELQFWNVGEGTLIANYSKASQKIIALSYWFSDGRAKADRKTFDFHVTSFDPETGTMTIRIKAEAKNAN